MASWLVVTTLAVIVTVGAERAPIVVLVAMITVCVAHGAVLAAGRPVGIAFVVAALAAGEVGARDTAPAALVVAGFAAGLFVAAELAYWACERRTPMPAELGVDRVRWLVLAALVPASALVAVVVLLAASASFGGSAPILVAGVASVVGVIVLVVALIGVTEADSGAG